MTILLIAALSLDAIYPRLDALYIDLHKAPELSGREERTGARMAAELGRLGFEVTSGVGGHGVVGVLKNGAGPTVLLRAELDGLPVEEKTGLPYASRNGAMHACGHDAHMAAWVGAAAVLVERRTSWSGTLVMVAQPAEETVRGARAMLADGLVTRFPKPDFCVAVHDRGDAPAGKVLPVPGYGLAASDSVDVTFFGRGGHGARPETTVDPIVIAARFVVAVQTLVSRERDPLDPGVVTVGSFHGGTKHNIISDEVRLQLTVRSFTPAVRDLLISGIERIARAEAAAANAPRAPAVAVIESIGATYNDPALTKRLAAALARELDVEEGRPEMGAEDFGEICRAASAPSTMLRIGAVEPAKFAAAKASGAPLPSLHSPLFAPDRERTIRTGAAALALSALELFARR